MTMNNFGIVVLLIFRVFEDEALSLGEFFAEPQSGFQARFCPVLLPVFFVANIIAVHVHCSPAISARSAIKFLLFTKQETLKTKF